MLEVKNGIAPKIISNIFKLSDPTHNFRNKRNFVSNHAKTVYLSTESRSYLGPKLWYLLLQEFKIFLCHNAVQISSKKMGSANLHILNLQGIHPQCWLYIIQSYFAFIQLICFSLIVFNQLICNYCFIYLLILIWYSWHELALYFCIELFFIVTCLYFSF